MHFDFALHPILELVKAQICCSEQQTSVVLWIFWDGKKQTNQKQKKIEVCGLFEIYTKDDLSKRKPPAGDQTSGEERKKKDFTGRTITQTVTVVLYVALTLMFCLPSLYCAVGHVAVTIMVCVCVCVG